MHKFSLYKTILKPGLDAFVAITIFLIGLPIFILVIILLAIANRGKVFFTQQRPGLNGQIFRLIKFKTMTDRKDANGHLLSDAMRITKIGKFIRSTSLDELPQLINVIKGDMSLIGPRPLLVKYLPLYNEKQARRHEVKPGITGWAQVNGRNAISWEQKFEYDYWYVAHQNFFLDVKILMLTIVKIFKRDGINAADAATMQPFTGK
jgi:lipopolysaccharide/colanic/teichoic acid biosynthesis glycosyltransferase